MELQFFYFSLLCRCNNAAKSKGYTYYSITNYGDCMGLKDLDDIHVGTSTSCMGEDLNDCAENNNSACVGKSNSQFVYKSSS